MRLHGISRDAFDRSYAAAGRGRDLPGTITIGLNPKIHSAPLMEDQALEEDALAQDLRRGGADGFEPAGVAR